MPVAYGRIARCFIAIQSAHFCSPCFIAQPGARIPFQDSQFADESKDILISRDYAGAIFSEDDIGEFERILDESHFFIDRGNP